MFVCSGSGNVRYIPYELVSFAPFSRALQQQLREGGSGAGCFDSGGKDGGCWVRTCGSRGAVLAALARGGVRLWGAGSGASRPRSQGTSHSTSHSTSRPRSRRRGQAGGVPAHVSGARPMARSRDAQRRLRARWGCARWRRAREGWWRPRRRDGGSRGPKGAGRGRWCRPRGAMVK